MMTSEAGGAAEEGQRIRTPDQRIRVFVSSTLTELAAERAAARTAITRMHLTPVMFELGARPHAPRELYRAYLAQSEVFVGIYWQQYGWVAPDEEVSGLEDEYLLSGERPKLIYVKAAAERQPRLTPAATTMVRASTISTELAPKTARMRMRVEVVCMDVSASR